MTIQYTHRRNVWVNPSEPVESNALFEWSDVDVFAIHYPGAGEVPSGDVGEFQNDIPPYLRSNQHFYLTDPRRGYSLGYNEAGDWLGGSWEIRGEDYECAANSDWNNRTWARQLIVDSRNGGEAATEFALADTRRRIEEVRQHAGHSRIVMGTPNNGPLNSNMLVQNVVPWEPDTLFVTLHNCIAHKTRSGCPGTGVINQYKQGLFMPRNEEEMTEDERTALAKEVAEEVWRHRLDERPAGWWLRQTHGIARKYLGGFVDTDPNTLPTETPLLQRIWEKVRGS